MLIRQRHLQPLLFILLALLIALMWWIMLRMQHEERKQREEIPDSPLAEMPVSAPDNIRHPLPSRSADAGMIDSDPFRRAHPEATEREDQWVAGVPGRTAIRLVLWQTIGQGLVLTEEEWLLSAEAEPERRLNQVAFRADSLLLRVTGDDHRETVMNTLRSAGYGFRSLITGDGSLQVWLPDVASIRGFDEAEEHLRVLLGDAGRTHRNVLFYPMAGSTDPMFADQWSLHRVNVASAWNHTVGGLDTVVAVIDSGIDRDHPDFLHADGDNLWRHPGEAANGVDDDGNGFVDDLRGWNFADDNNDTRDFLGHGTQMAGIIAAAGDNNFGISGVNHRAALLPLKVGNSSFSMDAVVRAVDYATELKRAGHPVAVVSNSYGSKMAGKDPAIPDPLYSAIERAGEAGILFVAAAGNDGINNDGLDFLGRTQHNFPSDYVLDNILSVTATDPDDVRVPSANYGAVSVDLAAPGLGMMSTHLNGEFRMGTGTSHACALVAGGAALLWAWNPGLSVSDRKEILMETGVSVPGLATATVSGRRLDIGQAMAAVLAYPRVFWETEDGIATQRDWSMRFVVRIEEGDGAVATVELRSVCGTEAEASWDEESGYWVAEAVPACQESDTWIFTVIDAEGRTAQSPRLRLWLLEPHEYWSWQAFGQVMSRGQMTTTSGSLGDSLVEDYFHGWQPEAAGTGGALLRRTPDNGLAWEATTNRRATDLQWRLEISEDLIQWDPIEGLEPLILWEEGDHQRLRVELPEPGTFVRQKLEWTE